MEVYDAADNVAEVVKAAVAVAIDAFPACAAFLVVAARLALGKTAAWTKIAAFED